MAAIIHKIRRRQSHRYRRFTDEPKCDASKMPSDHEDNTRVPHGKASPQIYVAKYQYEAKTDRELNFRKGQRMVILDKSDGDWWMARLLETQQIGYVPMVLITQETTLEGQKWYFGQISRGEANQLLLRPFNGTGAFLIREAESGHAYTLSVKAEGGNEPQVQHYKISRTQDGRLYIGKSTLFNTLNDLIGYYRTNKDTAFFTLLKYPCYRSKPIMPDISCGNANDKTCKFDRSALDFVKILGQGNYGEVWLGSWNKSVAVAIKIHKKEESAMSVEAFKAEAEILKRLRHPNILVLYSACTQEEPLLIVTEYMSEGDLLNYLRNDRGRHISFKEQLYMATQVASAMVYLEDLSLVHRDLAARNVLVGPSMKCKLADFGFAKALEEGCYIDSAGTFPVKWTAPEAFENRCFTVKSDVWSFGILAMEIITHGDPPYPGMSNQEVCTYVSQGGKMWKPANCPDAFYMFSYKCWLDNPKERPTFADIHETLSNVSTKQRYVNTGKRKKTRKLFVHLF